jgi:hypothetical protein
VAYPLLMVLVSGTQSGSLMRMWLALENVRHVSFNSRLRACTHDRGDAERDQVD